MPNQETSRSPGGSDAEIESLLSNGDPQVLETLLENPSIDGAHICRLLERKDLSTALLERIAARKEWLSSRQVRVSLIAHPRTPRRIALRLAREVYPLDLVVVSLSPSAPPEVRRFIEDLLISRLPQLPLGQKLALARRGSGRVAGGLLSDGNERASRVAIENSRLTEAQVLRVLAGAELPPQVIAIIGRHAKWSTLATVQAAVVRHPQAPLDVAFAMFPMLSWRDMEELACLSGLRPEIRDAIREHLASRAG